MPPHQFHLVRRDPARNMARFYRLDMQPDLFGGWCVVREWGRVGRSGQVRVVPYPTADAAQQALDRQRRAKERRGYGAAIAKIKKRLDSGTLAQSVLY